MGDDDEEFIVFATLKLLFSCLTCLGRYLGNDSAGAAGDSQRSITGSPVLALLLLSSVYCVHKNKPNLEPY